MQLEIDNQLEIATENTIKKKKEKWKIMDNEEPLREKQDIIRW